MDLDDIKNLFSIKVLFTCYGRQTVEQGFCTNSTRNSQLLEDKEMFYIRLQMINKGKEPHLFSFKHFLLSDSDGYFNEPLKARDYFQSYVKPEETLEGGLIFSIYADVSPIDLWFNSGHLYEDSLDAILIKIHIDIEAKSSTLPSAPAHSLPIHESNSVFNAENLLKKVIEDHRIPYKKTQKGYYLRLQCPDYRRQFVYVNFDQKDDQGDALVTLYTICAPVPLISSDDRIFLRLNSRFHYTTIAILELDDGLEYYTVMARQLAATCDEKELIKGLRAVSRNGDWLEAELTNGNDIG